MSEVLEARVTPRETMFIADIAGEYDALLRLIDRAPTGAKIVCMGDLVDRGPKSRDVIEYLMAHPEIVVLKGNHEDMMVDYFRETNVYQAGVWLRNGGTTTLANYGGRENVPKEHVDWLAALPYSFVTPDRRCFATHAPWYGARVATKRDLERMLVKAPQHDNFSLVWNRTAPAPQPMFNVFGHNSHWGLRAVTDEDQDEPHGLCIDQSSKRLLTAYVWPVRTVMTEPY